jgi:hypothetical protein
LPYYRYFNSQEEAEQIIRQRRIQSNNPSGTWWTTMRFDDPADAQEYLALPSTPRFRVGPIPDAMMPPFNQTSLRPVAIKYGRRGGGIEGRTREPVLLPGLYSFSTETFIL